MDIKNRKTTLDDDAMIYSRSKDVVTKEDIKNLSRKEKLTYFRDYYMKACLAVAALVLVTFYMLYTIVLNPSKEILSVVFLDGTYVEDTTGLGHALEDYIGLERKNDYVGVAYYSLDDIQMNTVYMTRTAAGNSDIIICAYSDFEKQSQQGLMIDLRDFLPQEMYESLSDRIVTGQTVEVDFEGNVVSYGEETPYGIDITDSPYCSEYVMTGDRVVLSVFAAPEHPENALKTVSFFTE